MNKERDYVLGTNDEEILRLGLQHRVWRAVVLNCWYAAGITVGSKVIDVGAGPGYATMDLAEMVGPTGQVTAVERSSKFVEAMRETCERRGLANVNINELDLMTDELPATDHDFSWCRWVASFVSDPALLIRKIAGTLRPGGCAIFHEYGNYRTWQLSPHLASHEEFVEHIIESWRQTGGKTDIALDLPPLLVENGFTV
jgi:ubiquinone/menaquinone biosynthesis C-methylase UbiE